MRVLEKKRILLISPEPWGKIFLSKHYFALELADHGNTVFFLEPAWDHLPSHSMEEVLPHIFVMRDSYHPKGLRFFPLWIRKMRLSRAVKKLERAAGGPFDVVWSFDNSRWFDLGCFKNTQRIHHVVDLEMDHHLREAATSADLCLGVTHTIVSRLKLFNPSTHFVQHGFRPVTPTSIPIPQGKNKIKALYCGNLLMHFFDLTLIRGLAEQMTDIDFILVGSTGKDNLNNSTNHERTAMIEEMRTWSNVFFTGEVGSADAQTLMQQVDILLLAYFNYPREVDNSSKLLQYLATGNVVVANFTREYEGTGLLEMAGSREEYAYLLRHVANHLNEFNSKERMQKRKQAALDNTYQAHLAFIDTQLSLLQ